ncbi:MAG: DUF1851 domain-containing protein [Hyphomonadaceae bacterium]|nr:DUF1851 domain-containing protein [Clostridia bacterium]
MYKSFCKYVGIDEYSFSNTNANNKNSTDGNKELFKAFGGQSFNDGLYRIHDIDHIERWNSTITEAFPEFKGRISCFGYDWLGRQFALDNKRIEHGQQQILMFEPGTAEVLEIPCDIIQFHNEEIPIYHDACLASTFFKEWLSKNSNKLDINECIGYKTMLFLGGLDSIQNLEKSDMDVYWGICGQLIQKTRGSLENNY